MATRTTDDIRRSIDSYNLARDEHNQFDNNPCACKYTQATRIKDTVLLARNIREPGWPGERTDFEIDRDQIMFNDDFVKLARKTQVFIGQSDVLTKNRLIHSMEVAQFAKDTARRADLALNSDLIESMAIGHDIGHTPFGHIGEMTLNLCAYEYHIRKLLSEAGVTSISNQNPVNSAHSDPQKSLYDNALWNVIRALVPRRYSPDSIKKMDTLPLKSILGDNIFNKLLELDIMQLNGDEAFFNPATTWSWPTGLKELVFDDYWLQDTNSDFFAHNINGLRILLVLNNRDICHQTAYGILAHSGKIYEHFNFTLTPHNVDEIKVNLSKADHETNEALLVKWSDDICFTNSDIDDLKQSDLVSTCFPENADRHDAMKTFWKLSDNQNPNLNRFPESSERSLFCKKNVGIDKDGKICFNAEGELQSVKDIIKNSFHPILIPRQAAAQRIVRDLFWFYAAFFNDKRTVVDCAKSQFSKFKEICERNNIAPHDDRAAIDFLARMTDDEIIQTHKALFAPEQDKWEKFFSTATMG